MGEKGGVMSSSWPSGNSGAAHKKASAGPVIATAPTAVTTGPIATLAWSPEQASSKATFMANLTKPAPHLWKTRSTPGELVKEKPVLKLFS